MLLLVVLCTGTLEVYARDSVLDIQVEGKGVQTEVYRIGEVDSKGYLHLEDNPEKTFPLTHAKDVKNVIVYLDEFVTGKAQFTEVSDSKGMITVSGLKEGTYYLRFSGGEYDRRYVSSLVQIIDDYQKIYPKYEESGKAEKIETVQTGDENMGEIYLILAGISLGTLVFCAMRRRKENERTI